MRFVRLAGLFFAVLCVGLGFERVLASSASIQKNLPVDISLYAAPSTKAQIQKHLTPTQRLLPIFTQGEWVKVGLPDDGTVGWINQKQYRQAVAAYYQPKVETFFVQSQSQDAKGENPNMTVVAYHNGKKLTDKEAKALYQQWQQQQEKQNLYFQHWFSQMQNTFNSHMKELQALSPPWGGSLGFPWVQPIILMPVSAPWVAPTPSRTPAVLETVQQKN